MKTVSLRCWVKIKSAFLILASLHTHQYFKRASGCFYGFLDCITVEWGLKKSTNSYVSCKKNKCANWVVSNLFVKHWSLFLLMLSFRSSHSVSGTLPSSCYNSRHLLNEETKLFLQLTDGKNTSNLNKVVCCPGLWLVSLSATFGHSHVIVHFSEPPSNRKTTVVYLLRLFNMNSLYLSVLFGCLLWTWWVFNFFWNIETQTRLVAKCSCNSNSRWWVFSLILFAEVLVVCNGTTVVVLPEWKSLKWYPALVTAQAITIKAWQDHLP